MKIVNSSIFRLVLSILLFIYGLRSMALSGYALSQLQVPWLVGVVIGAMYSFAAYLVFIPIKGKKTVPYRWSTKTPFRIAIGLSVSVFIHPVLVFVNLPGFPYNMLPISTHYACSIFAIVLAIGLNVRLEKKAYYKSIFGVLAISITLFVVTYASIMLYLIAGLGKLAMA